MPQSSRSGMRRYSARVLAGSLLALGLDGPSRAEPPAPPALSPYSLQLPGVDAQPRATPAKPAALPKPDEPPIGSKKEEPAKPKVMIGPSDSPPVPVAPPVVVATEPPAVEPPLSHLPPVAMLPPLGGFVIPAEPPGYYSFQDFLKRQWRTVPPHFPYSPTSLNQGLPFDADFRYLDDPANCEHDWADCLKRIHFRVQDNWLLSFGGEYRYRYMDETNSRLSGVDNVYSLFRARVWADVSKGDDFRLFIEFLGAYSMNQSLPPLPTDRDPAEIQNLFIDYRLLEAGGNPIYVRGGRQELLYGSQRLVSPNDWANARQRFDGVKAFWHSDRWDVDAFWTKPVLFDPTYLDPWDLNRNFSGFWTTWKPKPGTAVDLYVLNLNQSQPQVVGRNGVAGGFDITTFGVRTAGDFDGRLLYDHELIVQTGIRANQEVEAGAYTVGAGYRAKNCPWNPTVWIHNDWASGTLGPGTVSKYTTFNQLFPNSHAYLGYMDLIGRQNIDDFNVQLSINPQPWFLFLVQFHNFSLVSSRDALYDASGTPIRISPNGTAGKTVGNELDFVVDMHLTRHQDLLLGYSRFYSGNYLLQTGNGLPASLFYGQYSFRW